MTTDFKRLMAVLALAAVAACADAGTEDDDLELDSDTMGAAMDTAAAVGAGRTLTVELEPTEGNDVRGTVTFTEVGNAVEVSASLTGLAEGDHGFHIHETGDCSAPDASSAGGHFGPEGSRHGGPDEQPQQAHVGDMGNITADGSGVATLERTFSDMSFQGQRGIAGRAVVVHAGRDDLETQPSGDSGARVACGVIPQSPQGM